MRAKILHKRMYSWTMNNHFCSLGSKLASGIPDTVFQPEDFLNRTYSNFHPDPLIRRGGGGGDYCDVVWGDCSKHVLTNCKSCKIVQHGLSLWLIILCQIFRCTKFSKVFYLEERGKRHLLVTMFIVFNKNCPTYLPERFHRTSEVHNYNLRGSTYDLQLPLPETNFLKRSF